MDSWCKFTEFIILINIFNFFQIKKDYNNRHEPIGKRETMNNSEKLDYILNKYVNAAEVTRQFGFKSNSMISNMRNGQGNIARLHTDGLEKYFNIPTEIFQNTTSTKTEIDTLIKNYQKKSLADLNKTALSQKVFHKNNKLFQKLKGIWYAYLYASNPQSAVKTEGIWIVETTIHDDYSVIDYWGNRGYLKIGKHESLIIKESYDNDDLTVIRFPNRQIPSQHFRFVIISNQNNTTHEMVNYGFYSRIKYEPKEAKRILGDKSKVQLKLDLEFNDRINRQGIVPH